MDCSGVPQTFSLMKLFRTFEKLRRLYNLTLNSYHKLGHRVIEVVNLYADGEVFVSIHIYYVRT